jgi:hypothetical protein
VLEGRVSERSSTAEADNKGGVESSRRGEKFGPLLTYRFGGAVSVLGGMAMQ